MAYKDPEVLKAYQKVYRSTPEYKQYIKEYQRKNHRKYNLYGYTCSNELYNEMFINQNGCCAICATHQSKLKRQLAVDHCHTSGEIRGLLCTTCNTHLGIYEKSKEVFNNYLLKGNKRNG
jgi:hypothetical protein